ncbi:SIMPL domain-containing protein [Sphingomonas sp. R86521]|uniref:SIMPL domain-containing protein n=1 Tax=Sphingomonas sp. R86521 TaxID=3093860 RepID=UPI0036D3E8E7
MKIVVLSLLIAAGSPVVAQTPPPTPQILVSASGTAKTLPDMVTVGFMLRGEGITSDEAAAKLRDGAKAMRAGVTGLLHDAAEYHAANLSIGEVRSKECDSNSYGQQRLSTGACAIIGYVATLPVTIDTPRVGDGGTLVTLVGHLGGLNAGLRSFWLKDDTDARKRATQAALANAQAQARLIAEGSGGKLGRLSRVQDSEYRDVSLEMPTSAQAFGAMTVTSQPVPAPPPPALVRIDLAPEPIETIVRLMAAYDIER